MVSLQKTETTETVRAVEVEHLMTEEQATAAATKSAPVEDKPEAEVLELTPPILTVLADVNQRLEKAKEEAEHNFRLFMWAVFVIFVLLFTFVTAFGFITPHEPDQITAINVVQVGLGSLMIGTFIGNIMNGLNIHLP